MPTSTVYILNCIISDDSLFPKELSAAVVKKYKTDYFNYYLLCNFVKAVNPYFGERTEKIVCDIVEGILEYTFYDPAGYKTKPIKTGFDFLLRQNLKNSWSGQGLFYEYFWYSEQKDDRLLKKLRRTNSRILSECGERMNRFSYDDLRSDKRQEFVDVELEAKYAEYFRDEGGEGVGDFCFNYFRAELEYFKFRQKQETASLEEAVRYYEEAFKFIYHAGSLTHRFVGGILKIYYPITRGQQLFEHRQEELKRHKEYGYPDSKHSIEQRYQASLQFENKHFGFDVSSPDIRKISLKPLKTIWQWAEAAGIIHQVYDVKMIDRSANFVGAFYYYDSTRPKAQETLERLVADLEKED